MTHEKDFGANKETNNQKSLAENINEQTDLSANKAQRKKLRLILVGSPEVVENAIHHFHVTGYAEVAEWSRLLPCPDNPEEKMRILVRYITVE